MPNHPLSKVWAPLLLAALASACERDVQRSGDGDQSTIPWTRATSEQGSAASESGSSISGVSRGPAGDVSAAAGSEPAKMKIGDSEPRLGMSIEVERYSYEKRGDFEKYMEARLELIETSLEQLRASSSDQGDTGRGSQPLTKSEKSKSPSQKRLLNSIEQLEARQEALEDQAEKISGVDRESWSQFRAKFRDDVIALERSYQDLLTTAGR